MWRFILIFTGISLVVYGCTYVMLRRKLGMSKRGNRLFGLFVFIIAALAVLGPFAYRSNYLDVQSLSSHLLQTTQYFMLGWIGVNFLCFTAVGIIELGAKPFDPEKRIFLTEGLARGLVTATTLATVGGFLEAESKPRIESVEIKLATLPKSFDGIRIAQISDIHIGPLLQKSFLDGVVDQILSLNADMIFITGDLVDGTVEQLKDLVEPLKRLHAKEGVYFCTGNHEFYSGVADWIAHLESIGIHVFKNSNTVLTRKGANGLDEKLLIAGVHDWHGDQFSPEYASNPAAAANTTEPVNCKILLAHNPFSIEPAAAAGFHFQASGHTHAGQFYPFVFLVKLKLKHSEGLYKINDQTQLYVNRGTGFWGPPNRLGKHSEITHFTLRSQS
jgi:predicted MPP superfamily phosphohydrolase